jgi:hypothetical protein
MSNRETIKYFKTLDNFQQAALMVELTNIMSQSDITFTKRLLEGKVGEDFINTILEPEVSVEIKTDIMASSTGNIFIEMSQNGLASGLNTTQANLWSTVLLNDNKEPIATVIVKTDHLKQTLRDLVSSKQINEFKKEKTKNGSMTTGYALPINKLLNIKI